ncbi:hypothetical protein, partial [Pseudomonas tumuqii]|uniref:hypothetical protein n=1 Tax=Pseudomonas tumuqii TaxID=2715755 RepID=UPI001C498E50
MSDRSQAASESGGEAPDSGHVSIIESAALAGAPMGYGLIPTAQKNRPAMPRNRVGDGFTAAVLSHHRTYGSVYGGSGYAAKPVYRIQYRD